MFIMIKKDKEMESEQVFHYQIYYTGLKLYFPLSN